MVVEYKVPIRNLESKGIPAEKGKMLKLKLADNEIVDATITKVENNFVIIIALK